MQHASSSSAWAQGGLAAALGPDDSPEQHAHDTMRAGAGLVDPTRARALADAAAEEVERLAATGVAFEREADGGWSLSREAAHRHARVARIGGDRSGAAILDTLRERLGAARHVELRRGWSGAGLLTDANGRCAGLVVESPAGRRASLRASAVILATGGIGGLYAVSTNPAASQGQALAWAARVGARIRNAEFVQFHPTAMDFGTAPAPLATEVLRGEGARLVDRDGRRFMQELHPDAELAPRDVVARAVHRQRMAGGAWLDARCIGENFPARFPTVFEACRSAGLDPRHAPIPVAPAAHYHMGGVVADLDGRTDVAGLWVIGEAACTGVHGANRLASNSLLEAAVTARRTAELLRDQPASARLGRVEPHVGRALDAAGLAELRESMQAGAGVERSDLGLATLGETIDRLEARFGPTDALLTARMVADCARLRTESRGAHARIDAPDRSDPPYHSDWRLEETRTRVDRVPAADCTETNA